MLTLSRGERRREEQLEFKLVRDGDARLVSKGYGRFNTARSTDAVRVEGAQIHPETLVEGDRPGVVVGGGEPHSSTSTAAGIVDRSGEQSAPDTMTFDRGGDGDHLVLRPVLQDGDQPDVDPVE